MTKKAQDAYMRGFRKVAKAHGVEPAGLYKYAQKMKWFLDPIKRYWQLLGGGSKGINGMWGYRKMMGRMDKLYAKAFEAQDKATMEAIRKLQQELHTAANTGSPLAEGWMQRLAGIKGWEGVTKGVTGLEKNPFRKILIDGKPGVGVTSKLTDELNAVSAARWGTAAGLGGVGLGAYALSDDGPRYPRRRGYYGY